MDKVIIIAEAGVNHNGDINQAKSLVDVASNAGADYVKFQTFKANNLVAKHAQKAEYQKQFTDQSESHYEMIKKLELNYDNHLELIEYCKSKNIKFLSSPFDIDSIDLLIKLELDTLKIPSGEITNLPYLKYIGKLNTSIILSTGMANLSEIERAISILEKAGTRQKNLTVLHCNTEYPSPMKDVNLNAMNSIAKKLKVDVGYSDHTKGIEISIAAAAMGAKIIEKHFTLDRKLEGPDHAASLEPKELQNMVKAIRNIEIALGNGIKEPSNSEKKNIEIARKSIVAKCDIKPGEFFSEENITTKRPGSGISPMKWYDLIGSVSSKKYEKDDLITWND